MFLWSRPSCPCDPLPTDEFFPERYEPTQERTEALLVRICHFMGVTEAGVTLKLRHEPNKLWLVNEKGQWLPGPAGTYAQSRGRYIITLDTDELCEPTGLVATLAHELAHARLLGEGRLRGRHHDDELLTDLTAFFLGFAIFVANSPRVWVSQFTKWPRTRVNKPEYMTAPMYGYALGHLAWFQGRRKPSWAKYLGSHVINDFKRASQFLFKIEDSSFRPGPRPGDPPTIPARVDT
ncbi:MAG: hypothetical protein FJ118_07880 [Deltaproteobacteria bacterium]|nr:hypothetical protein [Deltaproteobacteria bacterium]